MKEQTFGEANVFRQGDAGDAMYVILSGTAVVTKTRSSSTFLDNDEAGEELEGIGEDNRRKLCN